MTVVARKEVYRKVAWFPDIIHSPGTLEFVPFLGSGLRLTRDGAATASLPRPLAVGVAGVHERTPIKRRNSVQKLASCFMPHSFKAPQWDIG